MQPSEYEIQREVEALRDLRRRSTAGGPGSLILDPDLPSASSQPSSTPAYWPPTEDAGSSSQEDSDDGSANLKDDPFHLFWVPARLHPEIAPAEFREFLKEHARTPADETGVLGRSISSGSTGLGRKKSMLSRQYKPSANDGVEDEDEDEEKIMPARRKRTSIYASVPQLTISDLQKLEELAEEASKSDDPSKLRSVLRRSLSLNVSPSVIDHMDNIPDLGDDADSPIVIPRPNQALRRSARTKIRKPGMSGEGSHRFTATRSRKKSITRAATMQEPRSSSDLSSSDHSHVEVSRQLRVEEDIPEVPPLPRPESFSEEALIYDAYATEDVDEEETPPRTTSPEPSVESSISPPSTTSHAEPPEPIVEQPPVHVESPILHHPQPQRAVAPSTAEPPVLTTSPSPQPTPIASPPANTASSSRPSLQESPSYHPPSPSPSEQRREKDKRGGLFKWGGDKTSKKQQKEKDNREREKEKETGFFGSLFGGRKKQEDTPPPPGTGTSGRDAAIALLGASKSSKSYVPPQSPQLAGMYARYPIHVERAIYRLSHIKLANPRRPLYEQVLISNLMFWYLGVINKSQAANTAPPNGTAQPQAQAQPTPSPDQEQLEREQREKEEHERAEKEQKEREQEQKERQRRGSLTKQTPQGSAPPGGRRAEMPVRGPQYEMQHRVMEQEYGYGAPANGAGASSGRTSSVPTSAGNPGSYPPAPRSSSAPPAPFTVPVVQPQPQAANGFYNMGNISMQPQQYAPMVVGPQLPPGAMPPVAVEQTWLANSAAAPLANSRASPPPRSASPPTSPPSASTSPRRARSPPQNRYTPAQEKQPYSGGRPPNRSLSASAAPPVSTMHHVNGKLKKGISAHAVVQNHNHRRSEEEDMPLALWQQQQRRK